MSKKRNTELPNFLKRLFRKKQSSSVNFQLSIDGVHPAPLTTDPDDAELAATALLESLAEVKGSRSSRSASRRNTENGKPGGPSPHDAAVYYERMADRIRAAHDSERQRTTRFVAYCEQELCNRHLPKEGAGSLAFIEAELYKLLDVVEREGGDLKRRWQHCLADVTVRLMDNSQLTIDNDRDGFVRLMESEE